MSTDIDVPMSKQKWSIHIEVRLKPRSTARFDTIRTRVSTWLHSFSRLNLSSTLSGWSDVLELDASVEKISTSDPPSGCSSASLPLDEMLLSIHVYQPSEGDDYQEFSNMGGDGAGDGDDDTMAATVRELPCRAWEGLWESLIYEDDVKMKLLDYIQATLVFSDAEVDFNLVSWNRVVLLHGPPGTGKTSLCRALAQKLSIRLSERYSHGRLLEINSHSLFSKWFSESGKLVQRLFTSITELADEEEAFLVVLIDEVESLTAARAGAMAGTEPSDGLRVVNALLTQLDKLKHRKNVLIMSTSNLVKAIDSAFIDRADIVQYIDLPPREAIYEILRTCLMEIVKRGIVGSVTVPPLQKALMYERTHTSNSGNIDKERHLALRLLGLATVCRKQELSGRALRRLPVLAMAKSLSGTSTLFSNGGGGMDPEAWLNGMERVVSEQGREKGKVQ